MCVYAVIRQVGYKYLRIKKKIITEFAIAISAYLNNC